MSNWKRFLPVATTIVVSIGRFAVAEDPQHFSPKGKQPSLQRQATLNMEYGLFEVVPGIYQVRGLDLANISFIKSKTGWIVIDQR